MSEAFHNYCLCKSTGLNLCFSSGLVIPVFSFCYRPFNLSKEKKRIKNKIYLPVMSVIAFSITLPDKYLFMEIFSIAV
jgi:hypothetical protein